MLIKNKKKMKELVFLSKKLTDVTIIVTYVTDISQLQILEIKLNNDISTSWIKYKWGLEDYITNF